jgi:ABC-2 type transport system ATP-binding protein
LKSMGWVKSLSLLDDVLRMTMEKGERRIPELIQEAQKAGVSVSCVNLRKPSLEDVFLHFTGRTIRDEDGQNGRRHMMPGHGR